MNTIRTLATTAMILGGTAGTASAHFLLRFTDQTLASGLDAPHLLGNTGSLTGSAFTVQTTLGGAGAGDFNNDGYQDLFCLGGGGGIDKLFWNNGDGTFSLAVDWWVDEQGNPVPMTGHTGGGVAMGDYDGDGWLDFYVTSHGPPNATVIGQHRLFHNNGDGTFTNVAEAAGVNFSSVLLPDGTTPTFGDYDLDGDLDLMVCGWRVRPVIPFSNRLFRNEGNGTFTDVTASAGVLSARIAGFTPLFCDMDGDIYPEILLASDLCFTRYLINNTDGTFTEFTNQAGVGLGCSDMGATVADFNSDGHFDWYISQVFSLTNPLWTGNWMYYNNGVGDHTYQALQSELGSIHMGGWGWGTMACDFNHDETIDLVEVNGFKGFNYVGDRTYLWLQTPQGMFVEVSHNAGMNYFNDGRGVVLFDYDNDVDMDMVIANHGEPAALWRNDLLDPVDENGNAGHALRIFLDTSNAPGLAPMGIGSRVIVTTATKTQHFYHGAKNTMGSQSELSTFAGLGNNPTADVRVEWTDGTVTTVTNVSADQTIMIAAP